MNAYDFVPKNAQATSPLASTKRSVYMTLPFVDFRRVLDAKRTQTRRQYRQYCVRAVLRQFESSVRAQRRLSDDNHVIDAEVLYNGRLMSDLEGVLRLYQLAEADIPDAAELIRLKLQLKYLVGSVDSEEAP